MRLLSVLPGSATCVFHCRLVINDRVYDITDFVSQHPGGAIILSVAGKDATEFFMELHKVRKRCMHEWNSGGHETHAKKLPLRVQEEILTTVAEEYFIGTIG